MKFFIYLFLFIYFALSDKVVVANEMCMIITLPEEDLRFAKDVFGNLETYLYSILESQNSMLEQYDLSHSRKLNLAKRSAKENVTLKDQLILLREMKEMLREMRRLLLGLGKSKYVFSKFEKKISSDTKEIERGRRNWDNEYFSRDENSFEFNDSDFSWVDSSYVSEDTTISDDTSSSWMYSSYTSTDTTIRDDKDSSWMNSSYTSTDTTIRQFNLSLSDANSFEFNNRNFSWKNSSYTSTDTTISYDKIKNNETGLWRKSIAYTSSDTTISNDNKSRINGIDLSWKTSLYTSTESSIRRDNQYESTLSLNRNPYISMDIAIRGDNQYKSTLSPKSNPYITMDTVIRSDNQYESTISPKSNPYYMPMDTAIRPADCSELLVAGYTESGVYDIYPFKCLCTRPVKAFCDMDSEGGGWTVFLSRLNTTEPVNFTKNWDEYKNGFGNVSEEYWLGNEALYLLTASRNYILRMEAKDKFGREIWGEWYSFSVASEKEKFRLNVRNYNDNSSAFDRFNFVNYNYFSTYDVDNDKYEKSCPEHHKGGWWYNHCTYTNPTGVYGTEGNEGIAISPWSKTDSSVGYATWLQLKIRPKVCSDPISVIKLNKHNCQRKT